MTRRFFELLLPLLLVGEQAGAAVGGNTGGTTPPSLSANVVYVNAVSPIAALNGWALTNAAGRAVAGQTLVVGPGKFHIPTNTFFLLKDRVNWFFLPGAVLSAGTAGDITAACLFSDWPDPSFTASLAITCNIAGYADFLFTNQSGAAALFWQNNPASKIYLEYNSAWHVNGSPCIQQDGGELVCIGHDFTRSEGYDAFLHGAAPNKTYFRSTRVFGGDSILEMGAATNWGDYVFDFDYGEALASGTGAGALNVADNVLIRAKVINFKRSTSIYGSLTNQNFRGTGVLQGPTIYALTNATVSLVQRAGATFGTAFKLQDCVLVGPWGVDPIEATPSSGFLTLENCTVVTGTNATNWVRPSAAANCSVRVLGRLSVNRTNHAGVTMLGYSYTTNADFNSFAY